MKKPIRAYDYVNHPYDAVRDAIREDAATVFQKATRAAEHRGEAVVAALSVDIAGVEVRKEIAIEVRGMREEKPAGGELRRVTHVELEWRAAGSPGLFPIMKADLKVYPLSHTETQIELVGEYEPPMGVLGGVLDAIAGHRLAEASVHRFVRSVVELLREELD